MERQGSRWDEGGGRPRGLCVFPVISASCGSPFPSLWPGAGGVCPSGCGVPGSSWERRSPRKWKGRGATRPPPRPHRPSCPTDLPQPCPKHRHEGPFGRWDRGARWFAGAVLKVGDPLPPSLPPCPPPPRARPSPPAQGGGGGGGPGGPHSPGSPPRTAAGCCWFPFVRGTLTPSRGELGGEGHPSPPPPSSVTPGTPSGSHTHRGKHWKGHTEGVGVVFWPFQSVGGV